MIYKLNREDFDYYLVSASDGIWDAVTSADLKEFVLTHRYSDLTEVCKQVTEKARKKWLSWD